MEPSFATVTSSRFTATYGFALQSVYVHQWSSALFSITSTNYTFLYSAGITPGSDSNGNKLNGYSLRCVYP